MSAHRMADKYPACIQYTAQYVRHDMSQLHKELYTRKKTDRLFSRRFLIFSNLNKSHALASVVSKFKRLWQFLFPRNFQAMLHGIYVEPIGIRMGFLCDFCTRWQDDKVIYLR